MHIVQEDDKKFVLHLRTKEAQEIASNLLDHGDLLGAQATALGRLLKDAGYALPPDETPHYEHSNPDDDLQV